LSSSARFGNQPAAPKVNIAAQADVFCKDLRALQEESHGIIRIGDEKALHQKVETYLTDKTSHPERALMIGAMAPSGAGKTTIMTSLAQAFARLLNGPISSTANVDKAALSLLPDQA
jgi:hypothetical protein